jgi:hypothetical protein
MQTEDLFVKFIQGEPDFYDFAITNLGKEALTDIFKIEHTISEDAFKIELQKSILDDEKRNLLAPYIQEIGEQLNIENLIQVHIGFNTTTCAGGLLALSLDESRTISLFWLRSDFDEESELIITDLNPIPYCLKKVISLLTKFVYYWDCVEDFEGMELWKSELIWNSEFNIIDYCESKNLLDSEMKDLIKKAQNHSF